MIKTSYKSVVVLFSICLVVAALLAAVNFITAPLIEESERKAVEDSLRVVFPDGEEFTDATDTFISLPDTVKTVYIAKKNGSAIGAVFELSATGYASGMKIMCGVGEGGVITGVKCLSSGETLGYEKTFGDMFFGKSASDAEDVDTVSGATLTTKAYKSAILDALKTFEYVEAMIHYEK